MPDQDLDEILHQFQAEFLQTAPRKVDHLFALVDRIWDDRQHEAEVMPEFRRELHNLKGASGSLSMTAVSVICHHLETYLKDQSGLGDQQLRDIEGHLNAIMDWLQAETKPDEEKIDQIVSALPQRQRRPEEEARNLFALLVSPVNLLSTMVELTLRENGCEVLQTDDPFRAIELACVKQPDLVVASILVGRIDGPNLLTALGAMDSTRKIAPLLITGGTIEEVRPIADKYPFPIICAENLVDDLAGHLQRIQPRPPAPGKRGSDTAKGGGR